MEATQDPLLKRQIDSELKNALKSEQRKIKQKRKLSEKDKSEPPAKKKKPSLYPITVRDVEECRKYFWTTIGYCPLINKVVIWSGLTNETMAHWIYPVLLGPVVKKDGKSIPTDYIVGVSRPPLVLSGLRDLFQRLYPDKNPGDFIHWDLYKVNKAYYTVKAEKISYQQDIQEFHLVETKPFGGPKDPPCIHWLEESKLKRIGKAIAIKEYLKDKDFNRLKRSKIPETAQVWGPEHLARIIEEVEKHKKNLLLAEKQATEKLNSDAIASAMSNLADESEESSDEE